jgi:low temperature requirement protein LtrA
MDEGGSEAMGDDENSIHTRGPRSEGNLELLFDLVFTFAMS